MPASKQLVLALALLVSTHAAPARVDRRCGASWSDANSKCGIACPSGTDASCLSTGERCFADLSAAPCAGSTSPLSTPALTPASTTTMPVSSCPATWTFNRKDCSGLPWQQSQRWHCQQQLPATTTPQCGASIASDVTTCMLQRQSNDQATWCVAPFTVCGGVRCASARACHVEFCSLGGRNGITISSCADGPAVATPVAAPVAAPTAAPTAAATAAPTARTTAAPTAVPTAAITATPTRTPTAKVTHAPTVAPSSGKATTVGCKATGAFLGMTTIDAWCVTNCAASFCPDFMCACA